MNGYNNNKGKEEAKWQMLFNKYDDVRIFQRLFICFRKWLQVIREKLNQGPQRQSKFTASTSNMNTNFPSY